MTFHCIDCIYRQPERRLEEEESEQQQHKTNALLYLLVFFFLSFVAYTVFRFQTKTAKTLLKCTQDLFLLLDDASRTLIACIFYGKTLWK